MAKVLVYYKTTTNYRGYIYYNADQSGGSRQYEKGTEVHLPVDYASRITSGRYPVIYPINGWINQALLNPLEAVYEDRGPDAPSIVLPVAGAITESTTPVIAVIAAEGTSMELLRSVDGGEFAAVKTGIAGGATVYDKLPAMGAGAHDISYKLSEDGGESDAVSISITVRSAAWMRSIASGDIISNQTISHQADITEMLAAVNMQRAYYGLDAISLPGTVGRFADWQRQMQTMLTAVNGSLQAAGQAAESANIGEWPDAATINTIRNGCRKA